MTQRCHHCAEFSRSTVVHRAAAEAGRGLPEIEPGMPLPAGTGLDRRTLLSRSAGMALVVYGASALGAGALDEGIARAAAAPARGRRLLLSVFVPGGADALSMLYPAGDPRYRRLRPNLALKPQEGLVFREDHRLHWHPSLAPLARLHGHGKVTVFPAIGYTHPDQSHFVSRHFWEVGALDVQQRTGWLGRYLDAVGDRDNPLQGLSLDAQLQPPLASARAPISNIASPDDYRFESERVWDDVGRLMQNAVGGLAALRGNPDPALAQAANVAFESDRLRRQLGRFLDRDGHPKLRTPKAVKYPDSDFARRLQGLAAMVAASFPIRAAAITAPGAYDTHADQAGPLAQGLKEVAESLAAFQQGLELRHVGGRVLTLVWTEFGRRPEENASSGTDHGAAGTAFLIGTRASGTMVGEFPGLRRLDAQGNVRATVDFRSVYASLLEQWLDHDAASVLPDARRMKRVRVVK